MSARPFIDVSELPDHQFDTGAPIWWGNLWMLAIETTMFALAFATYFYIRQNFTSWPPPRTEFPPVYHPLPALGPGTANLALLILSCIPIAWADVSARRHNSSAVRTGMFIGVLCGLGAITLRIFEFGAVRFSWDSNAYGSIVWAILILHLLHIMAATFEILFILLWNVAFGLDPRHRIDVTVTAFYWYWMVGMWVIFYGVVYWVPRLQ